MPKFIQMYINKLLRLAALREVKTRLDNLLFINVFNLQMTQDVSLAISCLDWSAAVNLGCALGPAVTRVPLV